MAFLEPGLVFAGHYRILHRLGTGGMGTVYEAEQVSTRKRRALKVLTNRFGGDDKAQDRFVREATVGAEIQSDHVVDVIGAGIDDVTGLPWLAMELLDGLDLKRLVDRRGVIEPGHLVAVVSQLGHGLGAAHAAGVVHRDLKPENVFVARRRQAGAPFVVKILDFGISKVTREAVVSTDTATIGSPMWMSPEQINAEPVSARTDVWSLGLLVFWALTGRVYWQAAYGERVTVQALFAEQLFADIDAATARAQSYGVAGRIPAGFDEWFSRCVVRDPALRFSDALAATQALESILGPWAAIRGAPQRALLPDLDAPDEATVARSEPMPSAVGRGMVELSQMAGTTADVMSLHGSQSTLHGSGASPQLATGIPGTRASGGEVPRAEPRKDRRAMSPAVVVAVASAILVGGAAAGIAIWPDDASDDHATEVDETPIRDAHVERPRDAAGELRGLPEPPATWPRQRADLSLLPAPERLEFLGWTADGETAALRIVYGSKMAARGFANYLELIAEVEGSTGSVTRTFVVERASNASLSKDDPLARAEAASLTPAQWIERRVELLLRPPEARRSPSGRNGELTMAFEGAPEGTRVRVQPKRAGFDLTWWGFDSMSSVASMPSVRLGWAQEGTVRTLLRTAVEVELDDLRRFATRGAGGVLDGEVRVFWSADGHRALVTMTFEAGRGIADRRWVVVDAPDVSTLDGIDDRAGP